MAVNPFEFVNSINRSKEDLFKTRQYRENDYDKFLVNRAMSYFEDTIQFANASNMWLKNAPAQSHFDYYRYAVPARGRFSKWSKELTADYIGAIMRELNYSKVKAIQVADILSKEDIAELMRVKEQGGAGRSVKLGKKAITTEREETLNEIF